MIDSIPAVVEQSPAAALRVHSTRIGFSPSAAGNETSGTCRIVAGVTFWGSDPRMSQVAMPLWYDGRAKMLLIPPPPAAGPLADDSFQTSSGDGDGYPVA